MKDATVQARTSSAAKQAARKVFTTLGMTESEAVHLFYTQVMLHDGLPFPIKVPNATTRKTFEATDKGDELHVVQDEKQLFDELGI